MSGQGASPRQIATVDTCFFLRFLTGDPPQQANQARDAIQAARNGHIELRVPAIGIAELVWTLESSIYDLPKREAADKAIAIINTPGIRVADAARLEESLLLHADKNIDFVDAYLACYARDETESCVYSFDNHFKRTPWIEVLS